MNLDILANGAPPPWRQKNDGKDSEKGSGPPRGRVARVMDRAHTPTHTPNGLAVALKDSIAIWRLRNGLKC